MLYPDELRNSIITRIKNGESVEDVSKEFKVPTINVYDWLDDSGVCIDILSARADKLIFASKVNQLVIEGKYDEALELCNSEQATFNIFVQLRKVKLLFRLFQQDNYLEGLDEALNICYRYLGNEIFNFQLSKIDSSLLRMYNDQLNSDALLLLDKIKELTKNKKYSLALKLCNFKNESNCELFDLAKADILMAKFENNYNKKFLNRVEDICRKYNNNEKFDGFRKKINDYLNQPLLLTNLLARIYYGNVTIEEIENSNIEIWKKQLLLMAYYEKNDKKKGLLYIKQLKKQYQDNLSNLKVINILNDRMASKKSQIFDAMIYGKYLKCNIDYDTIDEVSKECPKVLEENVVITNIKVPVKKEIVVNKKSSNKKIKKIVGCSGVNINRYNQHYNESNQSSLQQNSVKVNKTLIKDLFPQEVFEVCSYLYVQMNQIENRKAVKAWDNFEALINKSVEDKEALMRMISLLRRMEEVGFLTVKHDDDKIKKYLK